MIVRHLLVLAALGTIVFLLQRFVSDSAALWVLGAVSIVYALITAWHLGRLEYWASLPRARHLGVGLGLWGVVFDKLTRFSRYEGQTRGDLVGELENVHAAVDRLPDGLVVVDAYDQIVWSNNAAEALHGIFGAQRPVHHFIRQPEFGALLQAQDSARTMRIHLAGRPGRTYELRVHRSEHGQKLVITRDITEQARLDAMRSDFVANVSHEIRTPITVISGFAETLLTLDLDEAEQRRYLESILRQGENMQRLVDDLLTLSSLERGAEQSCEEVIDLHELLHALYDEARTLSDEQHQISLKIDGPQFVRAIPMEIESAIRNLLTNAIRYTPEGGRIELEWLLRDDEGWIRVRDTGIGIGAEHLPRIAERFYRVDRGRSRGTGGTGLGLAITKRIMIRHQGRLVVESEQGVGSTFTLRLPAARMVTTAAAEAGAPGAKDRHAAADESAHDDAAASGFIAEPAS